MNTQSNEGCCFRQQQYLRTGLDLGKSGKPFGTLRAKVQGKDSVGNGVPETESFLIIGPRAFGGRNIQRHPLLGPRENSMRERADSMVTIQTEAERADSGHRGTQDACAQPGN